MQMSGHPDLRLWQVRNEAVAMNVFPAHASAYDLTIE